VARYSLLSDYSDPALSNLTEQHLEAADVFVDMQLNARNYPIADIVLPSAPLTAIAQAWAKQLAAAGGALGDDSPLIALAKLHEKNALTLASLLTREALGLADVTGAAFGQLNLGRG